MPQLDLTTYNFTSVALLLSFWTYFSLLYIAVSYTSQKISAAYYFKFYYILAALLIVYALEVENSTESSDSLGFKVKNI
jgi:uncharacterized membrane protein